MMAGPKKGYFSETVVDGGVITGMKFYMGSRGSRGKEECCEASFHCPKCGGHHFGAGNMSAPKEEWTVNCHNEYGECGWRGVYSEHVQNDRA